MIRRLSLVLSGRTSLRATFSDTFHPTLRTPPQRARRHYVTKESTNWAEELRPIFRGLEQSTRKVFLLTLNKSWMGNTVGLYLRNSQGPENEWIRDLARKRFQTNCNTWKSRTMYSLKAHVLKLERDSPVMFGREKDIRNLQDFLNKSFNPDTFEVLFVFCRGWITIAGSDIRVRRWCLYIYVELCMTIKRHLMWKRDIASGVPTDTRTMDWRWCLMRFSKIRHAEQSQHYVVDDITLVKSVKRSELPRSSMEKEDFLDFDEDEFAFRPRDRDFETHSMILPSTNQGNASGEGAQDSDDAIPDVAGMQ
ncbi:hypothetical protein SODALDRAFT_352585 [Sodiomyces alkalinus F11]|uniref:Uncharacterized protein n=1 Tax=Sodiomyces alkalinus (strain CBS 110278 / VKM F-3762 / F11) TaxID=1314773 RepID=A0A3N2PQD8_SODAK|nr:hypothetical protein SODALDRAFT_352585 [Sodiomyces alkalinus F11]ROT36650.1 hypothetical protein SODALDRAFT_352585 [Sodiomyces alkalinus F11]